MEVMVLIQFFIGVMLLICGSRWLLLGAMRLRGPERASSSLVVVGLLALGGALPELIINLLSTVRGFPVIALGTVLGSSAVNILLIVGGMAIIAPYAIPRHWVRVQMPLLVVATVVLLALSADRPLRYSMDNMLRAEDGIVLLAVFLVSLFIVWWTRRNSAVEDDVAEAGVERSVGRAALYLALGLAALGVGGWMAVDNAVRMVYTYQLAQSQMGLLVIALVTAIPEITVGTLAARRGDPQVASGGIIASTMLNILFVPGVASLIVPIPIYSHGLIDMVILCVVAVALMVSGIMGKERRISRGEGIVLVALYIAFAIYVIARQGVLPRVAF